MHLSPETSKTRQRIAGVYVPPQQKAAPLPAPNTQRSTRRPANFRNHWKSIRKHAQRLLAKGMLHHERQLNSALLETLDGAFEEWLALERTEFEQQLESVPMAARGNWTAERLATCLLYTSPSPRD